VYLLRFICATCRPPVPLFAVDSQLARMVICILGAGYYLRISVPQLSFPLFAYLPMRDAALSSAQTLFTECISC
jgi:hypothetical protein